MMAVMVIKYDYNDGYSDVEQLVNDGYKCYNDG